MCLRAYSQQTRWPNVGLMLGHRLRRWPNINPTLGLRLMFSGLYPSPSRDWSDGAILSRAETETGWYFTWESSISTCPQVTQVTPYMAQVLTAGNHIFIDNLLFYLLGFIYTDIYSDIVQICIIVSKIRTLDVKYRWPAPLLCLTSRIKL